MYGVRVGLAGVFVGALRSSIYWIAARLFVVDVDTDSKGDFRLSCTSSGIMAELYHHFICMCYSLLYFEASYFR